MPSFSYVGRSGDGARVEGTIDGATLSAAAGDLAARGIVPVDIREAAAKAAPGGGSANVSFGAAKVQAIDVMLFSRQLYTLLRAGVPIMRALLGLQESSASRAMVDVIRDVRGSLDAGRELSSSLARHPRVFTPFYLSMVKVGELTGQLEEIFLRLFEHLDFERFMRDQVKAAVRYPIFVIATMALALVVVNIFVIPAFAQVYKGFKAELPLMTKVLIGFSNFTVDYWPAMLGGVVAGVVAFKWWTSTRDGRYKWHRMILSFPIAGKIIRKATLARFARSFALAMTSGVPVVQAMSVVAQTVDNDYIADKVNSMRSHVERGESVLRSAIAVGIFTPIVLQMLAVGEESGALDDMMREVAEMYQREVEYELKNLSAQIEPILIVCLGVLVLILALGIFLPIWDLGRVALGKGNG